MYLHVSRKCTCTLETNSEAFNLVALLSMLAIPYLVLVYPLSMRRWGELDAKPGFVPFGIGNVRNIVGIHGASAVS